MQTEPESKVRESIDHLFRQHAGRMVSILSRIFGIEKIDQIEDAVHDAMIAALKKWPYGGVPGNQLAWLIETAKNRMLDDLRRSKQVVNIDENFDIADASVTDQRFSGEIDEDQLRMIFACCHPAIAADSQVALTLKIVGGFSVAEIARAYLAKDEAAAKMLTRAKKGLRVVPLEIPAGSELNKRLDAVLRVLYLMFNEGYTASAGDDLVRTDLCFEAVRLVEIIARHPVASSPKVHALAALFHFQAARLRARTDHRGDLLLLADQDRSLWNNEMLARGLGHLRRAASGDELSDYHIEAEIASLHSLATDYDSTDWPRILDCYDRLLSRRFSPVVALNRVVAVGKIEGTHQALDELSRLAENYMMTSFNLFHVTRGHFLAEAGKRRDAIESYERALRLTSNETVKRFISGKIENAKIGNMIHRISSLPVFIILLSLVAFAQKSETERSWNQPVEPFRIIDNIYYVGASDVTSYLITTPKGHILIDSGFTETVPQIRQNVAKLGFKFEDIKILLNGHAHYDHAGGIAELKRLTKAKLFASEADAKLLARGGIDDPNFGDQYPFEAVTADQTFADGWTLKYGGAKLKALVTSGHTKGCTTWTTTAKESGRTYNVTFVCSTSAPGYKLVGNTKYPEIESDYNRTFERLKALRTDVFLATHGGMFGLEEKTERLRRGGPNPFIDPQGYKDYLERSEADFRAKAAGQKPK